MSELNSLYINIEIKKEKLAEFLTEKPKPLMVDDNIISWWKSRKMYSPTDISSIPQNHLYYPESTNGKIIEGFVADLRFGTKQKYNDTEQTWTFTLLSFSENFYEILPMVSFCKQLATHQEKGEKGIAIIYDFLWDDGTVMAKLDFSDQQATLTKVSTTVAIDSDIVKKANRNLQQVLDELSN